MKHNIKTWITNLFTCEFLTINYLTKKNAKHEPVLYIYQKNMTIDKFTNFITNSFIQKKNYH